VPDRETAFRQLDHLGHVAVFRGEPGQLVHARFEIESGEARGVLGLEPRGSALEEPLQLLVGEKLHQVAGELPVRVGEVLRRRGRQRVNVLRPAAAVRLRVRHRRQAIGFESLQVLQGGLLRHFHVGGHLTQGGVSPGFQESEDDLAAGVHEIHPTSFSTLPLKYHCRVLRRLGASAALVCLVLAHAFAVSAAAPPAWQLVTKIAGVVDVGGPRADGWLVVMGAGKLWLVDPLGAATPYPGVYGDDKTAEAYLTVVPQLPPAAVTSAAGCSFQRGDVYVLRLHAPLGLNRVDAHGQKTAFATIPNVTSLSGITFDTGGAFGYRIVVTGVAGPGKSEVAAIDCAGTVSVITRSAPTVEGGLDIAPPSFGAFGGMLIAPDELSGNIYAIGADGSSRTVAASGLAKGADIGVEAVGFVPHGWHGNVYFADRFTKGNPHPGTDNLLALTSDSLAGLGVREGDMLSATEGGATLIDVRCTATCTVQPLITTATRAHGEGHLIFTGATPVEPSPSPSAQPATSGRTGDAPTAFLLAAVTAALVVIVLAAVLVLRDLRAQRGQ